MRGKTIQIFLTDGSPRGIKLAEITSNIELAVFIPRNQINEAGKRAEVSLPGIYFLFGESEISGKPIVYIGQSRDCLNRIKTHDQKKDFWTYAVLIVSKTKNFTQTHIEYLEELAISKAYEANRYEMENGVSPKKFNVPETLEADLLDNFDTIKILLSTLGFPLFESFTESQNNNQSSTKLYCKGKEAFATGEYTNDGLVVFKGSTFRKVIAPTSSSTIKLMRERLLEGNVFSEKENVHELKDNFLFNSPSSAAAQILGRNANGWNEWKDRNGKSLDELKRKSD